MSNLDCDLNASFDEAVGADTQNKETPPKVEEEGAAKPTIVIQPETKAVATVPKEESKKISVLADDRGVLHGTNFDEQWRLATAFFKSGLMPKGLDSEAKVLVAMQLCREQNLPTVSTIGKIMVMNGTAAIHSELPLALVRRSGLLEEFDESWVKDEKGKTIKAVCTVKRKGAKKSITREFNVDDAKVAQLWGKTSRDGKPSPWVLYPDRMLQMRARSWALKDEFGDVLLGIAILEYDHNAIVVGGRLIETEEVVASVADQLNSTYLNESKAASGQ